MALRLDYYSWEPVAAVLALSDIVVVDVAPEAAAAAAAADAVGA